MRPKGENWGSQSQFSLLYSFVMIYHCRQDIIRQLVRAFDADAHGVFKCVLTQPAAEPCFN